MFERILSILRAPAADFTAMPEADARHALGALLVRVAKADGAYLFQEIEEIDHLLADLYDLNAVEAARMRAECEKLEEAMPDTNELAHILSDNSYDVDEIAQIDAVLMQRYGLADFEAAELRAQCEAAEAEAPDTVRFTRAIKDSVDYDDRIAVIEAMWSVALVDGVRDDCPRHRDSKSAQSLRRPRSPQGRRYFRAFGACDQPDRVIWVR